MNVIANATASCLASFSSLKAALRSAKKDHLVLMPTEKIEDEHARFKIWSGNLGATQHGRSSLDFRLRESTVILEHVIKLLASLHTTLEKSIEIVSGARSPLEATGAPVYTTGESSDEDSEASVDEGPAPTELSLHLFAIGDVLSDLYKLSFRIRNSLHRVQSLRPALYEEFESGDVRLEKFRQYVNYDRDHVFESFRQLRKDTASRMSKPYPGSVLDIGKDDHLVQRLATAITKRRRMLGYWKRHADKLAQNPRELADQEEDVPILPGDSSISPDALADQSANQYLHPTQAHTHSVPEPFARSILSHTEVSQYDRNLDDDLDAQSQLSYASTALDTGGNAVELPPAPLEARERSEFICPYCAIVCPSQQAQGRSWRYFFPHINRWFSIVTNLSRNHIFQDLQPYVCTYSNCSDEFRMYSNRHAWLEHERLVHRRVWQCFEHASAVYASSNELEHHLIAEHDENVTTSQVRDLLAVSESTTVDMRAYCPICLIEEPLENGLGNHIAFHLETFATFSLPRAAFLSDDLGFEEAGDSNKAQDLRSISEIGSGLSSFQSRFGSVSSIEPIEPRTIELSELRISAHSLIEDTERTDYSLDSTKDFRPPHSYSQLIGMALHESSKGQLTFREIYEHIERNYAYYRYHDPDPDWQRSIRYIISIHPAFEPTTNLPNLSEKVKLWRMNPKYREEFLRHGFTAEYPVRHPRGPPTLEELREKPTTLHEGSKNFASRSRRSALQQLNPRRY
ncbi:MAG: Checkpoint kinase 2 [Bogoriella megaspora]|nr:MAG: Checkpoint kinase 2 [Bogoriella megaspora]